MLDKSNLSHKIPPNQVRNSVKTKINFEEQPLLKRLSQGDKSAFWTIWNQHQNYLESRCLTWMNRNRIDADEALSRAMLKAWEKMPKYAEKITNPKAWLIRLTHNLCVDIHRERQKEEMLGDDEGQIPISQDIPELSVMQSELEMYIRHAIDSLPQKLRDVFSLYSYQEMSYADIAQHLAISNPNVRKRMQKAREILQKQVETYFLGLEKTPTPIPSPSLTKGTPKANRTLLKSQGKGEENFPLVAEGLGERLSQPSDKSASSASHTPMNSGCISQPINYKVTATCLESLQHPWYSSLNYLGWK